ncbi:MAG: hypothetical protein SFV51_17690 [Bryobacteraceae bacterium]|nr:hypothetical protein [Bryobacteraceae bacterium]
MARFVLFSNCFFILGFSRKAFLSDTLAGKAVMPRTLPLRIAKPLTTNGRYW